MDTWLIGLTNSLLAFLHKLCVGFLILSKTKGLTP